MRTNLKDHDYYERFSKELRFIIQRSKTWLDEGRIQPGRVKIVKDDIRSNYLKLTILGFTFGETIETTQSEFKNVIDAIDGSWIGQWTLKKPSGEQYDQYILSAFDEMLWMLSLGYLLNISEQDFKKLVTLIDADRVRDMLFEFIISAKLPDREPLQYESYQDHFGVPNCFEKLRESIKEPDKTKAEKKIEDFITKDWYNKHKDAGWYNSHKSEHDTFFGYWSFETAAVVMIMGLDDSRFKDCIYYPKDLVKK